LVIRKAVEQRENELLQKPISEDQFLFSANILSDEGSTTLVKGFFLKLLCRYFFKYNYLIL
jgi:hypothetical protein